MELKKTLSLENPEQYIDKMVWCSQRFLRYGDNYTKLKIRRVQILSFNEKVKLFEVLLDNKQKEYAEARNLSENIDDLIITVT